MVSPAAAFYFYPGWVEALESFICRLHWEEVADPRKGNRGDVTRRCGEGSGEL